jgi:hypothetical protein
VTSAVVRDVLPERTFHYVVRAVDASGNEDSNVAEVSATTEDETPPFFGGVRSVVAPTARTIQIEWGPAYDFAFRALDLVYRVYVKAGAPPDPAVDPPTYTSPPGEYSTAIGNLEPLTSYYVVVRVADPKGNADANARTLGVTTPEGIPPAFGGVKDASAEGTAVRIFWAPATDNATAPQNIV